MKSITFTDFRKRASELITEVEHGETITIVRHSKPIAQVIPHTDQPAQAPAWKQPGIHLQLRGSDLSSAVLDERESGW